MTWSVHQSQLTIIFGAFGTNWWQPVSISMIMEQQQVTYSSQHSADSSFQIPSRGKQQNDHARHYSLE